MLYTLISDDDIIKVVMNMIENHLCCMIKVSIVEMDVIIPFQYGAILTVWFRMK